LLTVLALPGVKLSISKKEERRAMPIYAYRCETCGPFVAMRRVANRDAACACPKCMAIAQRTLAMPALAFMSSTGRAERQVNERAVYTHQHGAGCGCGSTNKG
jgi:putative FmdB family regulatory protein